MKDIWINIQGIKIHAITAGKELTPLILLHGGGLDWADLSFRHCIKPFSQSHMVVAPDWPGFGESDKPDITYSTDFFVSILKDILDNLDIEIADIAGVSMGGAIAARFALEFEARVNKLILVDSYGLADRVPRHILAYFVVHNAFLSKAIWYSLRRHRNILVWALSTAQHNKVPIMQQPFWVQHRP